MKIKSKWKRQLEKHEEREKKRLYTFDEYSERLAKEINTVRQQYDLVYALTIANALNAPPLNFGKKRVCRMVKLIFDQIAGVKEKHIDFTQIIDTAKSLGITCDHQDNKFIIHINDESTKGQDIKKDI